MQKGSETRSQWGVGMAEDTGVLYCTARKGHQ